MLCYAFLSNVKDALASGMTPYQTRFEGDFRGPLIPFGAEVEYMPSSDKAKQALHPLGGKYLPGLFVGYIQRAGGGWSGDLEVVDWENLDKAKTFAEGYPRRIRAPEVKVIGAEDGKFHFPLILDE